MVHGKSRTLFIPETYRQLPERFKGDTFRTFGDLTPSEDLSDYLYYKIFHQIKDLEGFMVNPLKAQDLYEVFSDISKKEMDKQINFLVDKNVVHMTKSGLYWINEETELGKLE